MSPLDLGDRQLWPDGEVTVSPDKIVDYLLRSCELGKLHVTHFTREIEDYNLISDHKISVKEAWDPTIFPPEWDLPDHYKYLDLDEYLIGLVNRIEKDSLYEKRVERLSSEIWLFKSLNLDNVLKCLIYVVETMHEKNAVMGVGRGSSCSSYLLFLLGVHVVDPVKHEIEITDFIKLEGNRDA